MLLWLHSPTEYRAKVVFTDRLTVVRNAVVIMHSERRFALRTMMQRDCSPGSAKTVAQTTHAFSEDRALVSLVGTGLRKNGS